VALGVALLLAAASIGGLTLLTATPEPSFAEPAPVIFAPGTSSRAIAAELESLGVISSRWPFLALRALRPRAKLKAGEYQFEQPVSAWAAFEKIAQGKVLFHAVTIPEGFNRFEVADAVAKTGLVGRDEFLKATENTSLVGERFPEAKTLEGFLFPETYHLTRPVTAEQVIGMMVARFEAVLADVTREATSGLQPYEVVTLASLVEKETSLPGEHGLVSSVFHNRLRHHMLLQCDPTVIYGLILQKRYRGNLFLADLQDTHEYNTYVHGGLPPGPIANPGRGALEAAAKPAESDYLYFVAQAEGSEGHVFSKSLDDHNRAVAAYRRSQ
jgi:UPF0755 protein